MSRKKALLFLMVFVVGAVMLFYLDPVKYKFMPKCLFKLVTGLSCPGCGFQRAMHALLHGNIIEAIKYNLFLTIGIPYLFSLLFANVVLKGERQLKVLSILEGPQMAWFYVISFTIWFIVRNILHI